MLNLLRSNNSTNKCLQDENNFYSYSDVDRLISSFANHLFPRVTSLILADNTAGSVIAYLACLRTGTVPLLLPSDTNPKLLSSYISRYNIQLILCPDQCLSLLSEFSLSFSNLGYSVLIGKINESVKVHSRSLYY